MKECPHKKQDGSMIKIVGMLLPSLPKILLTSSVTFLKFKRRAKKAGRVFRMELIRQGVDKHTASELTGYYLKGSKMRYVIKTFQ